MEDIEIPSYFLCPISLEIMRDPVTLSTGITYDRDSIERWLFTEKHNTCPATKQVITDGADLLPNHTLRRLIQSWCTLNASNGIERFPTPRPSLDKAGIARLLDEAKSPQSRMESLCKLKSIISENDRNKRLVESSGFVDLLVSIVIKRDEDFVTEAISILFCLQFSEEGLLGLTEKNEDFIDSLTAIMRGSNYQARAYAILLLNSLVAVMTPIRLAGLKDELFEEIVKILRDQISHQAMKAALQALMGICSWGRNRIKAVNVGAVGVLIELMLNVQERRPTEMMLGVLNQLCGCAEGRAEFVGHAAGIAVVSKRIIRVSAVATARAVRILHLVSQFSASAAVLQEVLQVGAVQKICLLLQMDCGTKTREKAREILRLHSRFWKNSPCISPQLQASFPCS